MMEKIIIVATDERGAIGKAGAIPWHLHADMVHFRTTTTGYPVIMGRKTYESIGRPLPGRTNIVVSRSNPSIEGVTVVASLSKAYEVAEQTGAQKCFIMGGGQIYAQALADADTIILTRVCTVVEGADTFFPAIDPALWKADKKESDDNKQMASSLEFSFITLRKV